MIAGWSFPMTRTLNMSARWSTYPQNWSGVPWWSATMSPVAGQNLFLAFLTSLNGNLFKFNLIPLLYTQSWNWNSGRVALIQWPQTIFRIVPRVLSFFRGIFIWVNGSGRSGEKVWPIFTIPVQREQWTRADNVLVNAIQVKTDIDCESFNYFCELFHLNGRQILIWRLFQVNDGQRKASICFSF